MGATRVALAVTDDRGRAALWRDAQGDSLIPSVVYFDDDELVHGRAAKLAAATQPGRAAEFFTRDLGQAAYSRAVAGELLPPEVIEACLLHKLARGLAAEGVRDPAVVLALPAGFNHAQRRARLDAAKIAGLDVLGTINGPLAVAMAYADSQGYLQSRDADRPGCRVLVFDLGGSKLDVAIVEIKPGALRTMAVGGDAGLGGREWDVRLADFLATQFAKQFGEDPRHDMASVRRLLTRAEEAIQSLSTRQQARVQVERGDEAAAILVTRQAFEELTADLVDRAIQAAEKTLAQAGMAWRDIAQLLPVGGASRMPALAARLEHVTALKPAAGVHPDEFAARGAALRAAQLLAARDGRRAEPQVLITDLTTHSLGVQWDDPQSGRLENVVLIPRGTELPCGTVATAATDLDDASTLVLELLEGESRVADECAPIARLVVRDLPPSLPHGTPIEVHYQLTAEGRLQVKAQMPRGKALPISVRRAGALSEAELADWEQLLARGAGLKSVLAVAARHQPARQAARPLAVPAKPGRPSGLPAQPSHLPTQPSSEEIDSFALDESAIDAAAAGSKRRRLTPKKLGVLIGGYVISAILGTAIGYYILMWFEPRYNWWHLRLPGLREAPAARSGLLQPAPPPDPVIHPQPRG